MISKSAFKVIAFSAALSLQGVSAYADVLEDVAKAALENTLKEGVAKVKEAGSKVVSANIIENINIKKAELDRGLAQARAKSAEMGKEKAAELNALGKRVEGALAENVSRFNEAARKTPAEIKKPMSDIGNSVANRLKKMGAAMKSAPGKVANKIKKPMSVMSQGK
jgi:hypothetical protein